MTKTSIDPSEIKKGDLIRWEKGGATQSETVSAVEYTSTTNSYAWSTVEGTHYLLNRPKPPFEPYWGMVIGSPTNYTMRAVNLPAYDGDGWPWLTEAGWLGGTWAKEKLAEGWVIIEKPEGVK